MEAELDMTIRDPISMQGDVIYGKDLDTGPFVTLRDCTIGDNVSIWSFSCVDPGAMLVNNVKLHVGSYVSQMVVIEDDVFLGPHVIVLNDKYPPRYDKELWEPPIIRKGAIIGGGAVICPGVEIGERAIIAAGAVVVRDVPAFQLWAGVPATRLR